MEDISGESHGTSTSELVRPAPPSRRKNQVPQSQFPSSYGSRSNTLTQRASVIKRTKKNERRRQTTLLGSMDEGDENEDDEESGMVEPSSALGIGSRDSRLGGVLQGITGRSSSISLWKANSHEFTGPRGSMHHSSAATAAGDSSRGRNSRRRRTTIKVDLDALRAETKTEQHIDGSTHSKMVVSDLDDVKVTSDGRDVFESYQMDKPANSKFRWNLLWLVMCFFAPYPLWLSFLNCKVAYEITIVINLIMSFNYVYTTILCWRYMWRMIRAFNTPFWQELDPVIRDKVQHILVMPTYKEPVELLLETISSVANQTVANSIVMVVGMEEKTPEQAEKKRQINEQFGDSFKALIYAVHPSGMTGEIPGACSNRNFAARTAVKHMIAEGFIPVDQQTQEAELDFTTVTVCDADTTFFYRYFENLTWCFLKENPKTRYKVCWQSPLFYNIALDKRWFFTRVMGILRSYFMIGFLIGCDINTMSIYSQSLRLLIDSRYFHPGYQMDDIIYTLSAMKATGERIRIHTIDIPTLSGPTSGEDLFSEFNEWVVQATRWTIGAAEVFHYFFVKLLRGTYFLPGLAYFWWFVYYYGFVLCVAGLVNICNMIITMVGFGYTDISIEECKPFGLSDNFPYAWVFPFFTIFTYVLVYGTAFIMDALVCQILALDEKIHPIRNFVHFLSSQFVLWVYCLVEYKSIVTIAIYGKEVCGHKASEKHALVGGTKPGEAPQKLLDPSESSWSSKDVDLKAANGSNHVGSSNHAEGDASFSTFHDSFEYETKLSSNSSASSDETWNTEDALKVLGMDNSRKHNSKCGIGWQDEMNTSSHRNGKQEEEKHPSSNPTTSRNVAPQQEQASNFMFWNSAGNNGDEGHGSTFMNVMSSLGAEVHREKPKVDYSTYLKQNGRTMT